MLAHDIDVAGVGGTLTGNALALAAVRATLSVALRDEDFAVAIPLAQRWAAGVQGVIEECGAALARPAAGRPGGVLVLPSPARRGRGRSGGRRGARGVHAPVGAQPRRAADAVPQHGAVLAAPHRGRRRPAHRGVPRGGRRAPRADDPGQTAAPGGTVPRWGRSDSTCCSSSPPTVRRPGRPSGCPAARTPAGPPGLAARQPTAPAAGLLSGAALPSRRSAPGLIVSDARRLAPRALHSTPGHVAAKVIALRYAYDHVLAEACRPWHRAPAGRAWSRHERDAERQRVEGRCGSPGSVDDSVCSEIARLRSAGAVVRAAGPRQVESTGLHRGAAARPTIRTAPTTSPPRGRTVPTMPRIRPAFALPRPPSRPATRRSHGQRGRRSPTRRREHLATHEPEDRRAGRRRGRRAPAGRSRVRPGRSGRRAASEVGSRSTWVSRATPADP